MNIYTGKYSLFIFIGIGVVLVIIICAVMWKVRMKLDMKRAKQLVEARKEHVHGAKAERADGGDVNKNVWYRGGDLETTKAAPSALDLFPDELMEQLDLERVMEKHDADHYTKGIDGDDNQEGRDSDSDNANLTAVDQELEKFLGRRAVSSKLKSVPGSSTFSSEIHRRIPSPGQPTVMPLPNYPNTP